MQPIRVVRIEIAGRLVRKEEHRIVGERACHRHALLLADEPSGNLDAHNAERLHDLFSGLARRYETAVVVVTHNLLLSQRADRILSLEEGRLVPASGAGAAS